MLDLVRTKQKSILIKIAFGLIILSFVIGYTMLTSPKDRNGQSQSNIAATVNGTEISYSAFQNAYSNLYNLYQSIYQGKFNSALEKQLNLPKQALQQLIEQELLIQQADSLGLEVSKQELIDSIAQYDAFQVNGQFDRNRYLQVLNYQRLTAEQFEEAQRRQLLATKVREKLQQRASISDSELEKTFHDDNDTINLDYVWLTPALVESKVEVTDAGLKEFFEKNKEQFEIPEKISIRYVQFDPARYESQIAPFSDEELDRYYRRHLDQFEIKEEVKAAHILLKMAQDADEETVSKRQALAQEILKKLQGGEEFAQLAKTYSDDKSNADKGGELGRFGRGVMVPAFEDAAFALQPGQYSGVVRTPFGFHIIKVSEHTDAGVKPLVDVIAEVKKGLTTEKTRQLTYEKAMDAYNINRKSGDLDAAAKANDLGIKETGFFAMNEAIDGIGKISEVNQAAFALKEGEFARPIQTDAGVFLFSLKERKASHLPELAEVKAVVEQAYRTELAQTQVHELADKVLAEAKQQKSLDKAAKSYKLALEQTGEFSRSYGNFIPKIGSSAELAKAAFGLTPEAPVADQVFTFADRYLVASLKEAKVADFAKVEENDLKQVKEQLLNQKKNKLVADKLNELLQQAEITIAIPDLMNAFK